jgi:hypothetical protein
MDPASVASFTSFLSMVGNSGIPFVVTCFVFYFGFRHMSRQQDKSEEREKDLNTRLTKLEEWTRTVLVDQMAKNTAAAAAYAQATALQAQGMVQLAERVEDMANSHAVSTQASNEVLEKLRTTIQVAHGRSV